MSQYGPPPPRSDPSLPSSPMSKRTVYFYHTYLQPNSGAPKRVDAQFWPTALGNIETASEPKRKLSMFGVNYLGESRIAANSRKYIYLGRLRGREEWPDGHSAASGLADFDVVGLDNLVEPGFIVPFHGAKVAVIGRSSGAPRLTAMELWLARAMGLSSGWTIELRPILNPNFNSDLNSAVGATRFTVRVDKGKQIPAGGGGVGDALREAQNVSEEFGAEVTLTAGRFKASDQEMAKLAAAVKWAVQNDVPDKGQVNLVLNDPSGTGRRHVEVYDLVKQRLTDRVDIENGRRNAKASDDEVIAAVEGAVDRFIERMPLDDDDDTT